MTGVGAFDAADRYELYEQAVQAPRMQARFLRALHPDRDAASLTLGEDFCGSGALSRAWLRVFPSFSAVCVDHDESALARLRELAGADAPRLTIHRRDVMEVTDPADVVCALNFSICERLTRAGLVEYLRHVRRRLGDGGVFVADLYAGADAFILGESEVELRDAEDRDGSVRYIWEQREADPLTGRVVNAMHFVLPDGRVLRDAFVYHWRLWSVPELRDAMSEAGFAATEIHDRLIDAMDDEGRVYLRPIESPDELDDTFVVYVVGRRHNQA